MMKKIFFALLFTLIASVSFATEKIQSFDVSAEVLADGSIRVVEQINLTVEHREIRRGIIRVIPFSKDRKVRVERLEMDGEEHPYFIERRGNNLEINFGDDRYLAKGEHTYRLTYVMNNAVLFYQDYDELYWNVTGNDWAFPILTASFSLQLPLGAFVIPDGVSVYEGRYGAKGNATAPNTSAGNTFSYKYLRSLPPGAGLTVSVPFTKGIVLDKASAQKNTGLYKLRMFLLSPKGKLILILILFAGMTGYYYWAWKKVGKDPQARVIRQFEPPEGFSASMVRYVDKMKYDSKNFAVALVSLAVKGAIRIKQEEQKFGKKFVLEAVNQDAPLLSKEERAVLSSLFSKNLTLELNNKNASKIHKAFEKLKAGLQQKENKKLFALNYAWNIPGILAAGAILLIGSGSLGPFFLTFLYIPEIVFISLFILLDKGKIKWLFIGGILLSSPALFSRILKVVTGYSAALSSPIVILTIAAVVLVIVFWRWLKAYTPRGRALMNEIEGFKQYLSIAEEQRVAQSNPEVEARIFCDYLPYAFALDVESKWVNQFKRQLSEAMFERVSQNRGIGFVGGEHFSRNFGLFVGALGSSMVPPSSGKSRSGSFGGGFSGGGFGGGGGRGR